MKLNKTALIATLATLSLSAISAQATIMEASSKGELAKVVYSCEGKKTLDVIFVNTSKDSFAIINQVDEMIPLEIVKSASGANYKAINKDYTYELHNTEKAPFDNVKVRQALNYATDKKAIIDVVYQGAGVMAKNVLPPTIWSYNDDVQDYPFDIEKAKQLLAEAGYPNGFETEIWVQPVVRASNPNPRRMAEVIQNDWAKAGVKAKLVSYEWGDYIKRTKAGELTAGTYGWSGDNGDPDNFLSPLLGTENIGNSNYARWSNAEFDALLSKAISLSNQAERAELYKQAQVIAKEQAPWITVAHSITNTALSLRVKDYKQSPFGYSYFYGTKLAD